MKKLIYYSFFIINFSFLSMSAYAFIDRQTAVVRVLNKAAGKVIEVPMSVGVASEHEKLNVMVRACKQSDPFDAENFFAFVEITKDSGDKIFSGWLNRNEPGENPLQDADYDLWLVKCE